MTIDFPAILYVAAVIGWTGLIAIGSLLIVILLIAIIEG